MHFNTFLTRPQTFLMHLCLKAFFGSSVANNLIGGKNKTQMCINEPQCIKAHLHAHYVAKSIKTLAFTQTLMTFYS